MNDLEIIRDWIIKQPCSPKIRKTRLALFNKYRYQEDYNTLYNWITELGWAA